MYSLLIKEIFIYRSAGWDVFQHVPLDPEHDNWLYALDF